MSEGDVRTHLLLPARLLKDVDELIGRRKRSRFFVRLAEAEIRRLKLIKAALAAAGSLSDEDVPEWSTPEKAYAWVRDQRWAGQAESDRNLWGADWGEDVADAAPDEPDPPS